MPVFQPRNRVQILREMVARVVARSSLVGLTRNSTVFHVLAGSAEEDAEQYFEMSRLRKVFSLDSATGSDLDERAAEVQPNTVMRILSVFASATLTFTRTGTTGTTVIPVGTIVAGADDKGLVKYRTTSVASITPGNTFISGVPAVALEAGARANLVAGAINQFVTRLTGVVSVTNPSNVDNGFDRESDGRFRARLKAFIQAISRGTVNALESFAANVLLSDGRRVLFSKAVEPIPQTGAVTLYIDDGTGTAEEYSEDYLTAFDTVVASATGGEERLTTTEFPIRDDGSFALFKNAAPLVRDTDYYVDPTRGRFELVVPLVATDAITANYRHYTGLIQETQRVISGDPDNPVNFPGVQASGVVVAVKPPQRVLQTVDGSIVVGKDFDFLSVKTFVIAAVQDYINTLDIGEPVFVAEICAHVMAVPGVTNFSLSIPSVDQPMLSNQVARITTTSISIS